MYKLYKFNNVFIGVAKYVMNKDKWDAYWKYLVLRHKFFFNWKLFLYSIKSLKEDYI